MNSKVVKGTLIAGAVVAAMGPEWKTGKTKPAALCGVPNYDYRDTSRYSRIESVPSIAVGLREAVMVGNVPITPSIRSFVLAKPAIEVDHCKMNRVAVTLLDDGGYTVSFRAEQNASFEPQSQEGAGGNVVGKLGAVQQRGGMPNQLLNTGHLRRNEFNVRVTFYGGAPLSATGKSDSLVPGPVLMALDLKPFMVQRGEAVDYIHADSSPAMQKLFRLVDRVEVDLRYK